MTIPRERLMRQAKALDLALHTMIAGWTWTPDMVSEGIPDPGLMPEEWLRAAEAAQTLISMATVIRDYAARQARETL
jgi:hypothetical protein